MAPALGATQSLPYFYFDACSQALTAHFTSPVDHKIDAQACSSICATGGHSIARVDNFHFREFISFTAGYTHVSSGAGEYGTNTTVASATVEGLNILDTLTADRVVARTHSKQSNNHSEGHVTMYGCAFENLQIYGRPVTLELDFDLFDDIQTFQQAQAAYKEKGDFWKIAKDPFETGTDLLEQQDTGAFLCSLIKGKIQAEYSEAQVAGHSIYIPDFGRVYLAEMLISYGLRTFTMIRFDLDSDVEAYGSVACGRTNGKKFPP